MFLFFPITPFMNLDLPNQDLLIWYSFIRWPKDRRLKLRACLRRWRLRAPASSEQLTFFEFLESASVDFPHKRAAGGAVNGRVGNLWHDGRGRVAALIESKWWSLRKVLGPEWKRDICSLFLPKGANSGQSDEVLAKNDSIDCQL